MSALRSFKRFLRNVQRKYLKEKLKEMKRGEAVRVRAVEAIIQNPSKKRRLRCGRAS